MSSEMKLVRQKKKIDVSRYVNTDTGEYLNSELTGKGSITTVSDDERYVTISSDDYTIIDADALRYLQSLLNRSELGSLSIIASDLKTPINLVFNNNVPHTNESLQKALNINSNSTFNILIRKLMKIGVLYQIKGNIMGSVRVIYMMNPLLARKRSKLDSQVFEIFKKLE
jgi:predicted transcriptional regulator